MRETQGCRVKSDNDKVRSDRGRHLSFVFALFFLCAASLFAKGGVLSGAGRLSVIRTQYFDIIYPEEAAQSAEKIAAVADGYYEEIAALLQTDCRSRYPVTITRSVESANGYFTVVPYNAIVIQDVPPEISLDQNSDSLTSVFYHELTHAVTTTTRSSFSRFVSAVFGDWFAPAGFLETNFMHEGAAVSFESLKGEGRVWDPYARQMVVQAKIDGRFPSWRDVTGARDIFPGGTDAYAFGGMFCHFLQETYGMEKFAWFWKTTGSIHTFKRSIKKTYGKSVSDLWKDFEAWVPVPEHMTAAISEDGGTDDFFVANGLEEAKKTGFSPSNSRRSVLKCLDTSAYGAVWYDTKTGGVWYAARGSGTWDTDAGDVQNKTTDDVRTVFIKPKKLFTCAAVSRLSLSDDERYLAVSYLYADRTTKTSLALYDFRRDSLLSLPVKSSRDAGFVRGADGELLLSCVNISEKPLSVDFYALKTGGTDSGERLRKKDIVLRKQIFFADGEQPFSPCLAADGGFACIVKKGMDWKLRLYKADDSFCEYGAEKTVIHHLHSRNLSDSTGNEQLSFAFSYAAWGDDAALPRAGLFQVKSDDLTGEFFLQDDDVSGSVLDVAFHPESQGERLVYVGASYDTQYLMQMDFSRRKVIRAENGMSRRAEVRQVTRHAENAPEPMENDTAVENATQMENASLNTNHSSYPHISYNPLRYYANTMRIPIGMATSYKRDALDSYGFGYMNLGTAFVGATIASATPWQDTVVAVSGGWNPFGKNGGAYLTVSGGNDTFSYSANGNLMFDGAGFMQTTEGLSLAKTLYSRFGKTVSAGAAGIYFYGHDTSGAENGWSARSFGYVQLSNVRKMSPRYADSAGLTFQPFVLWERVFAHYVNVGLTAAVRIPGLFPISLSATLFPSSSYFASGSATVYLFSWEVQKGIPIAVYLDRLYLSATYAGKFSYQTKQYFDIQRTADIAQNLTKKDYSDVIQLKLGVNASVNVGVLARFRFDTGVVFQYRPNPKANEKKISAGVSSVVVY